MSSKRYTEEFILYVGCARCLRYGLLPIRVTPL